jgi:hypothetical protein
MRHLRRDSTTLLVPDVRAIALKTSMSVIGIFRHLRRLATGTTGRVSIFPNDGLADKGTTSPGTCDKGFNPFAELQAMFLAEPTAAA